MRRKLSRILRPVLAEGVPIGGFALALELLSRLLLVEREGTLGLSASLALLTLAALLQTACALVLAPTGLLVRRARWQRLVGLALWFGVPAALAFLPVARDLTSGDWIRQQSYAGALRWGLCAGATLSLIALAWAAFAPTPRFHRARIGGLLALGFAAQALHVRFYPGQYELLHLALWVMAALCVALASRVARTFLWPEPSTRQVALGALVYLLVAVLCAMSLPLRPQVAGTLAHRSERTSMLFGRVLPRRQDNVLYEYLRTLDLRAPLRAEPGQASGRLRLPADFNVLLIVVDTLRADTLEPARSQGLAARFDGRDTPFLDGLVQRSFRFERVYAQGTMTHLSMPPLFRSREPYDRAVERGPSLPALMQSLGRKPLAVVPQFFPERRDLRVDALLEGFDKVRVYKRADQNKQAALVKELLESAANTPFFAWIHYYAMHEPGWDGQRIPPSQRDWPANYARPLRWVDGQLRALFDELKRLHLDERTAVVIASDHGEGLRDAGMLTHGGSLAEVAVRVPLAFYLPGQKAHLIPHTVGNVDIVPTLHDLLAGQVNPEYAGRSLVPLFMDARAPWSRSYFTVAGRQLGISLVRGAHKHRFDRKANMHFHFDLSRDPREEQDLFDPGNPAHLSMLHEVVEAMPGWFATKSSKPWEALFRRRLREVDPAHPPRALPTLLELVRAARSKANMKVVLGWYKAADDRVRVLIMRHLFDKDPVRFGELLDAELAPLAGTTRAQAFVSALQGYPAAQLAAQRALQRAEGRVAPAKRRARADER